ncbi:MAG TPA: ice-binding family protein, partial [Aggregicoccus sp.]|nr:ice-binding family protein [Aggregicoccus sp.]
MHSSIAGPRYTCAQSRRFPRLAVALLALALAACGGDSDTQAPLLRSTSPADVATGVPLNAQLSAAFDMAMQPLSASSFTLKQGSAQVAGAVATSTDGMTAIFTPSSALAASTVFTATITRDAKSAEGAAFAEDRSWTFTTGTAADTTAPQVGATSPPADSTGVAINTRVSATFSKAMDPLSLSSTTFTLMQGSTRVSGNVAYGPGTTATFTPANTLPANVRFTATLTPGIKDLNGNALAAAFSWSFTTGATAAKGPAPVGLGTAGNYAILAKTGVSSVPSSSVTGDIGLSPAAASYLTGFSLVADATNVFSTSPQIVGKAYAADYAVPSPSNLTTAVSNMESAYTDAAGRPTPDFLELGTGNIGGKTLAPGLYKWTSTVTIPADVTLSGGANDVWILQTTGDLTMDAAKRITLSGGAQAKNVFWQVAGRTTFGANSHFEGVLLCKTDVTLQTGATMNGRVLSQS